MTGNPAALRSPSLLPLHPPSIHPWVIPTRYSLDHSKKNPRWVTTPVAVFLSKDTPPGVPPPVRMIEMWTGATGGTTDASSAYCGRWTSTSSHSYPCSISSLSCKLHLSLLAFIGAGNSLLGCRQESLEHWQCKGRRHGQRPQPCWVPV